MAFRSIAQVAAGVVAGAVLVGVPTSAVASQEGDDLGSPSDTTSMMGDSDSQMMDSKSKSKSMSMMMRMMMKDPEMRDQTRSMMSDVMGDKSGSMGDMPGSMGEDK